MRAREKGKIKMKQRISPAYDFQFEMNTIWLEWNEAVYNKSCVIDDFEVQKALLNARKQHTRTQIITEAYHNAF